MTFPQLAPDEPLSPELVLVLPPELRAQVIAGLGPPSWPAPRPRQPEPAALAPLRAAPAPQPAAPAPQPAPPAPERAAPLPVREPLVRSIATLVLARAVQLGVIFLAVTILTLALSLVAQAFR